MDFTHAATLVAAIYGITELFKSLLPDKLKLNGRLVVLVTLVVAIGITFLFAATVWAHTQVISGTSLSRLGTGDKFLVGLLLGGGATFLNRGVRAVMNVGDNQPKEVAQAIPTVVDAVQTAAEQAAPEVTK